MKRFYQFLGMATVSLPFIYQPASKVFALDESAEGHDLERAHGFIGQNLQHISLFSVTKERELANDIALYFNTRLGKIQTFQSPEGEETKIQIFESVRAKKVFLICSFDTSRWSFNNSLIDLLLTISAMKRSSPVEVNVVLPYFAYCRQSSITGNRQPTLAADIAVLLEAAGADKLYTVNLHNPSTHGSFNIPVLDIDVSGLCVTYFKKYPFKDLTLVCSNDRVFPQALKIKTAFQKAGHSVDVGILAKRQTASDMEFEYIGGELKGRDVLIIDSLIDTGDTALEASKCLNKLGANEIYMFAVHGVLTDGSIEKINKSYIKELVLTNTMPLNMSKLSPKINQISVASLIAETIAQSTFNKTLSQIKHEGGINAIRSQSEV